MVLLDLSQFSGYVVGPNDQRALKQHELQAEAARQMMGLTNAARPLSDLRNMIGIGGAVHPGIPEKPLDERFADFKVRLQAALDRRKSSKAV